MMLLRKGVKFRLCNHIDSLAWMVRTTSLSLIHYIRYKNHPQSKAAQTYQVCNSSPPPITRILNADLEGLVVPGNESRHVKSPSSTTTWITIRSKSDSESDSDSDFLYFARYRPSKGHDHVRHLSQTYRSDSYIPLSTLHSILGTPWYMIMDSHSCVVKTLAFAKPA